MKYVERRPVTPEAAARRLLGLANEVAAEPLQDCLGAMSVARTAQNAIKPSPGTASRRLPRPRR
jgi:hypothetical protein